MINKVLGLIARATVGRSLLDLVAKVNGVLAGHRTEILLGVEALLFALKKLGVLPAELAAPTDALATALLGAIPVTLAEKVKRAQDMADSILPAPPEKQQ